MLLSTVKILPPKIKIPFTYVRAQEAEFSKNPQHMNPVDITYLETYLQMLHQNS